MKRLLTAVLLAVTFSVCGDEPPPPAPLSGAETAAVEAIAAYLAEGPDTIVKRLHPASPLRSMKDPSREISARLGPQKASSWTLLTSVPSQRALQAVFDVVFESDIDDTIVIGFRKDGERLLIDSVRTHAEPVPRPAYFPVRRAGDEPKNSIGFRDVIGPSFGLVAALPALLICGIGLYYRHAMPRVGAVLGTAGGAMFLAALGVVSVVLLPAPQPVSVARDHKPRAESVPPLISLAPVADIRTELARGGSATSLAGLPKDAAEVAQLWRAQLAIRDHDLDAARRTLERFPVRPRHPMAELLRARLSYFAADEVEAVKRYERALTLGPGCDGLWYEAGELLMLLGYEDRGAKFLTRAIEIGSRHPDLRYELAAIALFLGDVEQAEKQLVTAFRSLPQPRADLLEDGMWWMMMQRPAVSSILRLNDSREEILTVTPTGIMSVPDVVSSTVVGTFLELSVNGSTIDVPGGAFVAPATKRVVDAVTWREELIDRALAELPFVTDGVRRNAFGQPAFRDRALEVTNALIRRQRWRDLAGMTESLNARDERVPFDLITARALALFRLGETDKLRKVTRDLIANPIVKRKKDPMAFAQIAELLFRLDEYDAAIKLLTRSREMLPLPGTDHRLAQMEIEKALARDFSVQNTSHFVIRYPPGIPRSSVDIAGAILEKELARLTASTIPLRKVEPIVVNLLWYRDFRTFAGDDYIMGLFTDEIYLPLAGVERYPAEAVLLMTHELAHALIAQATDDRAPRWFHEGLATRAEMAMVKTNAFRAYSERDSLAIGMLDPVLGTAMDPALSSQAYETGETLIRFLEARYGTTSLHRLMEQFRNGADTAAAIRSVTGRELYQIDSEAHEWGRAQPEMFAGKVLYYGELQWSRELAGGVGK